MNSKIYTGQLMHARLQPMRHEFTYPVYFYAFDLAELPTLARQIPCFSYNRWNLVSLHDKDFLDRGHGDIRSKLIRYLEKEGLAENLGRIELVTCARYFGYVFNPVSFFYCYKTTGELGCAVAQVNNTFGESHLYVLQNPRKATASDLHTCYDTQKEFHVSPFFDRTGQYQFYFSPVGEKINIHVNLIKEGRPALLSAMQGNAQPLTTGNLIKTLLRYPLSAALTIPRIHYNAWKLFFFKKLRAYKKPAPSSPKTIRRAPPNGIQKICMTGVLSLLSQIQYGRLTLALPDGGEKIFGGKHTGTNARIEIRHDNFFWRLVKDSGIGLGEGYMERDWDSPDPTDLLKLLIENKPFLTPLPSLFTALGGIWNHLKHLRRKNTLLGSRRNIHDHYDLGNSFFELFLDEGMTYSCGIYDHPEENLAQAQKNKITRIIQKARIRREDHVLEIGCGWGSFAIEAVRQTGCRVTGITISQAQLEWARQRVKTAGLDDRIDLKLCDYRHLTGAFDKIVSIEMLEAVGHEYLGAFFETCERVLKPNCVAVIQVITIPDQRYESYRNKSDFIQKHIFPGGHLPSLSILSQRMSQFSNFVVEDLENIGAHYARTLRQWRERFDAQQEKIESLGFPDRIIRAWRFYFSYCEAAFQAHHISNLQLILMRVGHQDSFNQGASTDGTGQRPIYAGH